MVCLLSTAGFTYADVLRIKPDAPRNYVVKKGDTLWDISGIYLDKPWHWPKLWKANPQIEDPHWIYPGDRLTLVYDAQGNPQLVVNAKHKKLQPQIRIHQKDSGSFIKALPVEAIEPFLENSLILNQQAMDKAGFIIAGDSGFKQFIDNDRVSVNGVHHLGMYHVIRLREVIYDEEGEILGALYDKLAVLELDQQYTQPDVSKGALKTVKSAVKQGDRLIKFEPDQLQQPLEFIRGEDVAGKIVAGEKGQRFHGKWDLVILDKGARDSVSLGQVLAISHVGPTVTVSGDSARYQQEISLMSWGQKIQTPDIEVGEVVVVKVYNALSLALITRAHQPIRIEDEFANAAE